MWVSMIAVAVCAGLVGCAAGGQKANPPASQTAESTGSAADTYQGAKAGFLEYISRNNAVDLTEESTIDSVLELTVDPQTTVDREFLTGLQSRGWSMEGSSAVIVVVAADDQDADGSAKLDVCVDTSSMRYFDESGAERKLRTAPSMQQLRVTMTPRNEPSSWQVSSVTPRSDGESCAAQ